MTNTDDAAAKGRRDDDEDDGPSIKKRYEILATNARHRTDAMAGWFRLYLQLYSAIVGGAIWLRLQAAKNPKATCSPDGGSW